MLIFKGNYFHMMTLLLSMTPTYLMRLFYGFQRVRWTTTSKSGLELLGSNTLRQAQPKGYEQTFFFAK